MVSVSSMYNYCGVGGGGVVKTTDEIRQEAKKVNLLLVDDGFHTEEILYVLEAVRACTMSYIANSHMGTFMEAEIQSRSM